MASERRDREKERKKITLKIKKDWTKRKKKIIKGEEKLTNELKKSEENADR